MNTFIICVFLCFFRENLYRVNVTDHKNGSQTFNEMKTQSFDYEASKGLDSDIITVPDIPYIVSIKKKKKTIKTIPINNFI